MERFRRRETSWKTLLIALRKLTGIGAVVLGKGVRSMKPIGHKTADFVKGRNACLTDIKQRLGL